MNQNALKATAPTGGDLKQVGIEELESRQELGFLTLSLLEALESLKSLNPLNKMA